MRKLIVAVTLVMGFMGTAHAVDMIDPRSVPHSDYEISNGSDGKLYCKNCGGQHGWTILKGFEPLDDVTSKIVGAGWNTAIYWESMGASCYYGSWIAINLKSGDSKVIGPDIEANPEICQSEPDEVDYEITKDGWTMTVAGKTYKGKS